MVFFISQYPRLRGWFLVSVYVGVEVLGGSPDVGLLWDLVPEEYRGEIIGVTWASLGGEDPGPLPTPTYFLLRAEKRLSTPIPWPMRIDLEEDLGVRRLGQALYKYLDLDAAVALLDKAIEHVERLAEAAATGGYWAEPEEALRRLERLREAMTARPALIQPQGGSTGTTHELREASRRGGVRCSGMFLYLEIDEFKTV